jgi:hypothetical protein
MQHWYAMLSLACVALYRADDGGAHALVMGQWGALRRSQLLRIQYVRVRALHVRARSELAVGSASDAARTAERILRERAPWADPLADLVLAAVARQRGDAASARALLEKARGAFVSADMAMWAQAAARRLGEVVGGDEGGRAVQQADAAMRAEGVADPVRFARMMAPGFG